MLVYHGSDHVISMPEYHGGKRHNDFGYGFYTTEDIELAKEWACGKDHDGVVNKYDLDIDDLKVLRLNSPEYNILNWLAILARYRTFWQRGSIAEEAKKYLQDNFFIDPEQYDVIIGYRADDSYFSFAQDFVTGTISLRKLSEAMCLGKLGEQIVMKSRISFDRIRFTGSETAKANVYYEKKMMRDLKARREYRASKTTSDGINEIYMLDIMREGIKNGDPRL